MSVRRYWQLWWGVLAVVVWLAYTLEEEPPPSLVRPRAAASLPFLPDLPKRPDIDADATELQASRMWGVGSQLARATTDQARPPNWMLVGVYGRGHETRLVVRFEEDRLPVQELRVGDPLPSGDVILEIEPSRVCVAVGKHKTRRWLPVNVIGNMTY